MMCYLVLIYHIKSLSNTETCDCKVAKSELFFYISRFNFYFYFDVLFRSLCAGCPEVGQKEKQTQDELWETEPWPALLLWQEYHPQDIWEALCLPLCLWLEKLAGLHTRRAARNVGRKAWYRRVKAELVKRAKTNLGQKLSYWDWGS